MKNKLIYGLIAGAAISMGLSSCNNEDYLNVTHYSLLQSDFMFLNDDNAIKGMTGCYDLVLPDQTSGYSDDPYKYWIFNGSHPTMDSQASGWDKDFMTQNWHADNEELYKFWKQSYGCISRCNDFLVGLEAAENISADVKKALKGEAIALRAFEFFGLANTFGRVPLLATGETYTNTPEKARAKDYAEMWDFVISDLEEAIPLLDWQPFRGQYGRCTKGMALTFLGDAYMWKAYRCPEVAPECYQKAYDALKQVYDSGVYELNPSFSTLYDAAEAWPKEAIWQVVINAGDNWGEWNDTSFGGARGWTGFYFGAPANGAWGSYACSWEIYDAFEVGDKRRDASLVAAAIPADKIPAGKEHWKQSYTAPQAWLDANEKYLGKAAFGEQSRYDVDFPMGYNPYNQELVLINTFHREPGDPQTCIYSMKHWHNGRGTHWAGDMWLPDHIYFKRFANVILDLAECAFRTGKESEGWKLVDQIRNRAFGNLEVGKKDELNNKYLPYFQGLASRYGDNSCGMYVMPTEYPIPFNETLVDVVPAKDYYTALKASKGFTSDVWKVAVNEERRKEFNAEPYLRADMHKSDYLVDHINHNYPMLGIPTTGDAVIADWRTPRDFEFSMEKMTMPIPQDELIKNKLCDQNEGY